MPAAAAEASGIADRFPKRAVAAPAADLYSAAANFRSAPADFAAGDFVAGDSAVPDSPADALDSRGLPRDSSVSESGATARPHSALWDAVELGVAKLGSGRTTASPAEGRPDSSRVLPDPTCFYPFAGLSQPANHTSPPVETCRARLCPFTENLAQGVAVTSSCTCSSSSMSKSAYNSSFLSRACRSPTAVPGCTGKPSAGGFVGIVSA